MQGILSYMVLEKVWEVVLVQRTGLHLKIHIAQLLDHQLRRIYILVQAQNLEVLDE